MRDIVRLDPLAEFRGRKRIGKDFRKREGLGKGGAGKGGEWGKKLGGEGKLNSKGRRDGGMGKEGRRVGAGKGGDGKGKDEL